MANNLFHLSLFSLPFTWATYSLDYFRIWRMAEHGAYTVHEQQNQERSPSKRFNIRFFSLRCLLTGFRLNVCVSLWPMISMLLSYERGLKNYCLSCVCFWSFFFHLFLLHRQFFIANHWLLLTMNKCELWFRQSIHSAFMFNSQHCIYQISNYVHAQNSRSLSSLIRLFLSSSSSSTVLEISIT